MRIHGSVLGMLAAVSISVAALAAEPPIYPSKAVRVIVAFAPGGGPDLVARLIGQQLSPMWGQQIIVDNKPGAGGILGTDIAAKAPADGYTWVMVSSSFAITPGLRRSLPYDPVKDFSAVSLVALYPVILVVHPSLRIETVQDLIALAKRKADALNYASSGNGTPSHLAAELFKSMTGAQIVHVPYKSAGPALTDLLGGHIDLMFATLPSALGHVKNGELKALAVGGAGRVTELPDVPTVAESGVPGYEASGWSGVLVPAGTPQVIIEKINRGISDVLKNPDIQRRLSAQGAAAAGDTPEGFSRLVRNELTKWSQVIRATGVKGD
jgi:tripartite-type tricarboxylate transporter receptor subunit TctC